MLFWNIETRQKQQEPMLRKTRTRFRPAVVGANSFRMYVHTYTYRYFKQQSNTRSVTVLSRSGRARRRKFARDCQTRRLLIGGHDGAVRRYFACEESRGEREGEGEGSRFDPRMIIRRQVISGSRYTGRVMGKTVTLLSYPLWIHSIQPPFVRAPFLSVSVCAYANICRRILGIHDRMRFMRSRVLTHSSSNQSIMRVRDGPMGTILLSLIEKHDDPPM